MNLKDLFGNIDKRLFNITLELINRKTLSFNSVGYYVRHNAVVILISDKKTTAIPIDNIQQIDIIEAT